MFSAVALAALVGSMGFAPAFGQVRQRYRPFRFVWKHPPGLPITRILSRTQPDGIRFTLSNRLRILL